MSLMIVLPKLKKKISQHGSVTHFCKDHILHKQLIATCLWHQVN